jgi:hypothetical protein
MPVHDWRLVEAGIFHHFHNEWLTEISNALNGGRLPRDYYALIEQHAGQSIADILTLHTGSKAPDSPPMQGGVAVAESPPRVRRTQIFAELRPPRKTRRRTLTIRHVTGHRIIALLEVVSPANKDRLRHVTQFARKVAATLHAGIHVLVVDLFAPGKHDSEGMHGAIAQWLDEGAEPYDLPAGETLTLASYVGATRPVAYLEHLATGGILPEMPLFLDAQRYVRVPLETTYQAAYRGVPEYWRGVLEGGVGTNGES